MGFKAGLLILWKDEFSIPKSWEEFESGKPQRTVSGWSGTEFIDLGRVTAESTFMLGGLEFGSDQRARICFAGVVVDNLARRLGSDGEPEFAPQILTFSDVVEEKRPIVLEEARTSGFDVIDPGFAPCSCGCDCNGESVDSYINKFIARAHNKAIRATDESKRELAKNYNFITETPLLWAGCTEVVNWLDDCEESENSTWKHLVVDEDAVAQWKAWREHLREISRRNTRILFRFSHR